MEKVYSLIPLFSASSIFLATTAFLHIFGFSSRLVRKPFVSSFLYSLAALALSVGLYMLTVLCTEFCILTTSLVRAALKDSGVIFVESGRCG